MSRNRKRSHWKHCRKRAKERFGVDLDREIFNRIQLWIRSGIIEPCAIFDDRLPIYSIYLDGVNFPVLFGGRLLVTVLDWSFIE